MNDIFEKVDNFKQNASVKSHLILGDYCAVPSPSVAIVMPVFNHPDWFEIALRSAIQQDFNLPYEIVVVDNNDLNDVPTRYQRIVETLDNKKVFYYRNEKNIGMFGNLNRCIELARAPYLTFLHDDDELCPNLLKRLMKFHHNNVAVFSPHYEIDKDGRFLNSDCPTNKKYKIKQSYKYYLWDHFNCCVSPAGEGALFSKSALLEIGGFNPEMYPSSDYALIANYTYHFKSVFQSEKVFKYRIAENESFSIYEKYDITNRHIYECIARKLCLPRNFSTRLINAKIEKERIEYKRKWGALDEKDIIRNEADAKLLWRYSLLYWRLLFFQRNRINFRELISR